MLRGYIKCVLGEKIRVCGGVYRGRDARAPARHQHRHQSEHEEQHAKTHVQTKVLCRMQIATTLTEVPVSMLVCFGCSGCYGGCCCGSRLLLLFLVLVRVLVLGSSVALAVVALCWCWWSKMPNTTDTPTAKLRQTQVNGKLTCVGSGLAR